MTIPLLTVEEINRVTLAAPCPASWDKMRGDDRVRFCDHCQRNVYNLSEMTAAEAVQILRQEERTPCGRFFMRQDGTAITSDFQAGWRWSVWKRLRKRLAWAASLFAALFLPACGGGNMVSPSYPVTNKQVADNPNKGADSQSGSETANPGK